MTSSTRLSCTSAWFLLLDGKKKRPVVFKKCSFGLHLIFFNICFYFIATSIIQIYNVLLVCVLICLCVVCLLACVLYVVCSRVCAYVSICLCVYIFVFVCTCVQLYVHIVCEYLYVLILILFVLYA